MVSIEASSGPCVFIDSAPRMLSPSSICTSALASGPRPMPPYCFGTNGHHRPCARALVRSLPSTSSSGLASSSFSAGMHSSCTHLRTFSRIAFASAGTSKSIDMAFPRSGSCWLGLRDGIYPGRASGNDKQSLKARAIVAPASTGRRHVLPRRSAKLMPDLADLFPGYASEWINTGSGRIFARVGGKGPPLLLLHGFSETHVMWHRVAPQLADRFTLIVADLPGYGWSDMPDSDQNHTPYTKRAMAQALVEAMEQLGHVHFGLAGHDRGGRVAYRLALDHPGRLERLAVLDIVPTWTMWHHMDARLANRAWHWMFLALPAPFPETMIGKDPLFYFDSRAAAGTKIKSLSAFDPRAP